MTVFQRLPFLVSTLFLLATVPTSRGADQSRQATPAGLTFACAADNDLYRAMAQNRPASAGVAARFDAAADAVAAAPVGSAVLVLSDGHPASRVAVDVSLLDRAVAKKLRLYIEYPEAFPGVELGEAKDVAWERGVVADESLGAALPPMRILGLHGCRFLPAKTEAKPLLVLAHVAGYDRAVYGLPPVQHPLVFRPRPNVLLATTKLSGFVRSRFAPHAAWVTLWERILDELEPVAAPHKLAVRPAVRPAFTKDEPLPPQAERDAAGRFAQWLLKSGLLVTRDNVAEIHRLLATGAESCDPPAKGEANGDGSLGILEGFGSQVRPDGGQVRRIPLRSDCQAESAAALAIGSLLAADPKAKSDAAAAAKNLLDFTFFNSGFCKGVRADPKHPTYGLIAWGDVAPAWLVANYGDNDARVLLGTMLTAACLKTDAWDEMMLRNLHANLRTTGRLGFRTDNLTVPALEQHGWRYFHDAGPVNPAANFEAYLWACYLWAYRQTGEPEFLDKTKSAIKLTMRAYPDGWRWGDNMERARMLLPLAWLVRVEDTPEHRGWLKQVTGDLLQHQDPSGGIPERLRGGGGGHYFIPATNAAYGTTETPLIQENGDPVSDQLYTTGFALLGLHEAAAATGEPYYKQEADQLAAYLVRIQVRSEAVPYIDGSWFRAFDFGKWDFWASSADIGWGAWSVEAGWCQVWSAVTLGLRDQGTSLWELTAESAIESQLPKVREQMKINTGNPWVAPKPTTP